MGTNELGGLINSSYWLRIWFVYIPYTTMHAWMLVRAYRQTNHPHHKKTHIFMTPSSQPRITWPTPIVKLIACLAWP